MRPSGLRFWFPLSENQRLENMQNLGRFSLEVDYFDTGGEQAEITRFYCSLEAGHVWRIAGVALFNEGEPEPYVSSGEQS